MKRRQVRELGMLASVGLGIGMLGLYTGGAHAGVVTPRVTTSVTVTAIPTTYDVNLDITSGTIESTHHKFNNDGEDDEEDHTCGQKTLTGDKAVLEQFTAISTLLPTEVLQLLINDDPATSDPNSTVVSGVVVGNPELQEQLTSIMNDPSRHTPSLLEFLTATSSKTELAYSLPPTQVVGTQTLTMQKTDDDGNVKTKTVTVPVLQATGPGTDTVQIPSKVTNVHDVGQIAHDTIGGRVALTSSTEQPLGPGGPGDTNNEELYLVGPATQTTTTTSITTGAVKQVTKTTTVTQVNGIVDVSFYAITGQRFISPIILDVSGSGKLEASGGRWLPHPAKEDVSKMRLFDFFANGFPMVMEWAGPHDGILVEPKADGTVDGSCLFGTQGGWDNGYEKLSIRDTNHDGKLTGDELKGLYVWVDANQNAVCDPGEMKPLSDYQVSEINLNFRGMKSTFVMNGQTRSMWDWYPSGFEVKHVSKATMKELVSEDGSGQL